MERQIMEMKMSCCERFWVTVRNSEVAELDRLGYEGGDEWSMGGSIGSARNAGLRVLRVVDGMNMDMGEDCALSQVSLVMIVSAVVEMNRLYATTMSTTGVWMDSMEAGADGTLDIR